MRALAFLMIVGLAAPAAAQTHPFPGVTMVRDGGGTMIVADLCAAGVSVRATRYGERRATPGAWGARGDVGAAVAVNGDFYDFPSAASVSGRARGAGEDWPPGTQNVNPEVRSYWQFGPHLAGLVAPSTIAPLGPPAVTEIVGAHNVIIRGGRSLAPDFDGDGVLQSAHARTAIGLSADGRYLYLFATRTLMTGTALANAVLGYAARAGLPQVDVATNEDGGGGWAEWAAVDLSTGRGFVSAPWSTATPTHMRNGGAADYRVLVGDFNGDGRSDLATISRNGGGGWSEWVAVDLSTGSGFVSTVWRAGTPTHMRNGDANADYRVLLGDFNGDGRSDLATVSPTGAGGWSEWVAMELSTGAGFTSTVWRSPTPMHMRNGDGRADYRVLVGDFNGDGRSDIATVSPTGAGGWADWVAMDLSTGGGFASTVWAAETPGHMRRGGPADYRVLVGDVDADGRSDLVTASPNGGGGWANWASVELDTGGGFASAAWVAQTPLHMRNGAGTPLAPRSEEGATFHRPRRMQAPMMDAGALIDGAATDRPEARDAMADLGRDVGRDVGRGVGHDASGELDAGGEEQDAGDDGPEGRALRASCGCLASGDRGRAGWWLVAAAFALISRRRTPTKRG